MPKTRHLLALFAAILAATFLVGVSPAQAAGNHKCDTNSPQWNVTMCVRTDAEFQTDGSGWQNLKVRVYATGNPDTLESCPAFSATVYLKKHNGDVIWTKVGEGCEFENYSETFKFGDLKFPDNCYVVVYVQMYDNDATDPDVAKISLPVVD